MHIHCKKSNTEFIKHNMKVPVLSLTPHTLNAYIHFAKSHSSETDTDDDLYANTFRLFLSIGISLNFFVFVFHRLSRKILQF